MTYLSHPVVSFKRFARRLTRGPAEHDALRGINSLISAIDENIGRAPIGDVAAALDAARVPLWDYFTWHLGSSTAGKLLALKILNLLLAKHHFLTRSTILLSRPYGLVVDPSNGCNLACPGCVHSARAKGLQIFDWNKGLLPEQRFRGFLNRYGIYAVNLLLCNYGEPLTNPNTPRLVEIAKEYLLETVMSTNLAVSRFDAEAYVRSGLDFLILSIDGATQSVYEKYRKNGNIRVVYRNLENLIKAKRALRKRTPVLRWQFLAFEHNAHEIPLALEIARSLGVDQFAVETPFDVSWDDPAIRPAGIPAMNVELDPGSEDKLSENYEPWRAEPATDSIEREFDATWTGQHARLGRSPAEPAAPSNHTCHWLYKNMTMDAHGRILPCCCVPGPELDLVFSTFDAEQDCFSSEQYQAARLFFADPAAYRALGGHKRTPYCTKCKFDQANTAIGPEHAAQYLRAIGRRFLDAATIKILSDW